MDGQPCWLNPNCSRAGATILRGVSGEQRVVVGDMHGHHYDGVGVCIYCNQCNEPTCCEPGPCTRSLVRNLQASAERIRVRARFITTEDD